MRKGGRRWQSPETPQGGFCSLHPPSGGWLSSTGARRAVFANAAKKTERRLRSSGRSIIAWLLPWLEVFQSALPGQQLRQSQRRGRAKERSAQHPQAGSAPLLSQPLSIPLGAPEGCIRIPPRRTATYNP